MLVPHNLLRKEIGVQHNNHRTTEHEDVGGVLHLGEWRSEQHEGSNSVLYGAKGRRNPQEATALRNIFKEYFMTSRTGRVATFCIN